MRDSGYIIEVQIFHVCFLIGSRFELSVLIVDISVGILALFYFSLLVLYIKKKRILYVIFVTSLLSNLLFPHLPFWQMFVPLLVCFNTRLLPIFLLSSFVSFLILFNLSPGQSRLNIISSSAPVPYLGAK